MSELTGKHGLIVGIANKRSIAWAIAKAAADAGALSFSPGYLLGHQLQRDVSAVVHQHRAAVIVSRQRAQRVAAIGGRQGWRSIGHIGGELPTWIRPIASNP